MQVALTSLFGVPKTPTLTSPPLKASAQVAGNSASSLTPPKSDQFVRFGKKPEDDEDKDDEPLKPDLDPEIDDPDAPLIKERLDEETRDMVAHSRGNGVYYHPTATKGLEATED